MDNYIGALLAFAGIILSFIGGRETAKASALNTNVQSITELSTEVRNLGADRRHDRELIDALEKRTEQVENDLKTMERKNTALWKYVTMLIDFIRKHGLVPPQPPIDLESDPKMVNIMRKEQ